MVWVGHSPSFAYFDDLRTPATAINPPGNVNDPDIDTAIAGLLFDANTEEMVSIIVQLPHSYKEGTDLEPHVHWQKTTSAAGNVDWQIDYRWARINEVMDGSWTTLSSNTTVAGTPDDDTANKHLITALGSISGAGAQISDMLMIQLRRDANDATNDTYGADARLLEFDIHYEQDAPGSRQEFIK